MYRTALSCQEAAMAKSTPSFKNVAGKKENPVSYFIRKCATLPSVLLLPDVPEELVKPYIIFLACTPDLNAKLIFGSLQWDLSGMFSYICLIKKYSRLNSFLFSPPTRKNGNSHVRTRCQPPCLLCIMRGCEAARGRRRRGRKSEFAASSMSMLPRD